MNGIPKNIKVLILPSCYALSDVEARRIRAFCDAGGTVIADFACGLFDQHGKGRAKGALDDLFGVVHDGSETKNDFFAGALWVETNQDAGYSGALPKLFATLSPKLEGGFAVAERKLPVRTVRRAGSGTAVYLNLSPQRYLLYRQERTATDAHRAVFTQPILQAGVRPWVRISVDGQRPANTEATYFTKQGRTIVFVVQNAAVTSTSLGETKTSGLGSGKLSIEVAFPAAVRDVVDERSARKLGDGSTFRFEFNAAEAAMLSFQGPPPGR